jgi:LuxR family maltose regulon positive regulatory protein
MAQVPAVRATAPPDLPGRHAPWNAAPLTKFRTPRVRRDVIARPALLQRMLDASASVPVTLICAPGGSGKTSLLSQLAAHLGTLPASDTTLLWIALDEDDNDRHRFLAALLRAAEALDLAWETRPGILLANAAASDSQCRAALAEFVNALCTTAVRRIVLVLDDLHRVDRPDVLELLESLIERLPDHVALILGSRIEPALPLARWRAHGELAEFIPWDLQFTEPEALALAAARLGSEPDVQAVRDLWRRTQGWAAGLTMALNTPQPGRAGTQAAAAENTHRHLFAYLAQEILADLPDDLRDFALRCSVLSELSPAACMAVSGREDSQRLLEALYRRNLFVTATDDSVPVLRFHDLFREFLENELERRYPDRVNDLHQRAGHVESSLARSIAHFVRAQRWDEAMQLMAASGESMLAEGDHTQLERWLDQIPQDVRRADPKLCYLRGICAWLRWDWSRARSELQPAVDGLDTPEQAALRVRATFLLVDACNSTGDRDSAMVLLEELARLPLDPVARAQLALQRAWCALLGGDPQAVGNYLRECLAYAEQDPATLCPRIADRFHLLCIGLPGVADCFERYFALTELVRGEASAPWHLAALPIGAWGHFWHGRREPIQPILERGNVLLQKFGGMRLISERLLQFRTQYDAASGQFEAAIGRGKILLGALQAPEAIAHRAVWLRAYQHSLARMYWLAGDHESFRALAPALLAPRLASEWPFIETAIELVRGQMAILRSDWRSAEAALEQAVRTHERHRMPFVYGDPRVSLAYLHLLRGDRARSWEAFAPVIDEVLREQALGLLLLEPVPVVDALLEIVPADLRRAAELEDLLARLARWRPTASAPSPAPPGPLAALSEREQDVLARVAAGASNKHIARDLSLSLHTVKRHIANILDKLDCTSRGQAADLYRRLIAR